MREIEDTIHIVPAASAMPTVTAARRTTHAIVYVPKRKNYAD